MRGGWEEGVGPEGPPTTAKAAGFGKAGWLQ
ncbi:DUF6053 domain-containing protein [Lysobacter yananisis]